MVILKKLNINKSLHKKIEEDYNEFSKNNLKMVKIYKNVKTLLKIIEDNNIKISIVTSKNYNRTSEIIKKFFSYKINFVLLLHLKMFKKGRGKPYPDSLYKACLDAGTSLDQSLYIGDMEADYKLALNTKIKFIHANWGYGKDNNYSIGIESPDKLIRLFK